MSMRDGQVSPLRAVAVSWIGTALRGWLGILSRRPSVNTALLSRRTALLVMPDPLGRHHIVLGTSDLGVSSSE